jgi:hypothetical protein
MNEQARFVAGEDGRVDLVWYIHAPSAVAESLDEAEKQGADGDLVLYIHARSSRQGGSLTKRLTCKGLRAGDLVLYIHARMGALAATGAFALAVVFGGVGVRAAVLGEVAWMGEVPEALFGVLTAEVVGIGGEPALLAFAFPLSAAIWRRTGSLTGADAGIRSEGLPAEAAGGKGRRHRKPRAGKERKARG